jgi:hypothetical protein
MIVIVSRPSYDGFLGGIVLSDRLPRYLGAYGYFWPRSGTAYAEVEKHRHSRGGPFLTRVIRATTVKTVHHHVGMYVVAV